jgi:HlyD family secretion protein
MQVRDSSNPPTAVPAQAVAMDRALPATPFYRRWALPACGALALTLLIVLALSARGGKSVRLTLAQVSVAPVQSAAFHDFVALRAQVVPRDIVYLDAQEGGRVERVLVQAGDTVTAGQPLVEFGNTELQLEVIEREVRVLEQINSLRSTELTLEQDRAANEKSLAEIRYNLVRLTRLSERKNQLARQGAAAVAEKEDAADELAYYKTLEPVVQETTHRQEDWRGRRLPEIRDELQRLTQNLAVVRGKLDNLIVRAPVSGRLTDMDLKLGQSCPRGMRLAQITPATGFKLAAQVDEYYLARVHAGQRADVDLEGQKLPVTVSRVYPTVKDAQFTIDLQFSDADPTGCAACRSLLAGEALQGKLRLGEDRRALVLPAGAFLELTGGDWVFVLETGGHTAVRRRIRTGRRSAEQLEIVAGLAAGERVMVSDYRGLERIERIDFE